MMTTSCAVTHGLCVSRLARFFRAGALRCLRGYPKLKATSGDRMPAVTPTPSTQPKPRPFGRTKRAELSPKQVEVLDWIENFIVPALVEKYIQERVLNREVSRG